MAVAGDHHVHRWAHLARLVDDLADELGRVGLILGGPAGMGEHHDRLHPATAQFRNPVVDRVGNVDEAEARRVALQQEPRGRGRRDADEAHPHAGTLGNHEFDEGGPEALRLVGLARYPYVAANTVARADGELILPPYRIVQRAGVKVGFIGVTTEDTPYFLLSEFARQYRWTDLSPAVNRWVPELQRRGVEAIVVLAHAGAFQDGDDAAGEIVDEAREMSSAVDVVIAGHSHSRLDLRVPNPDGSGDKLVIEALSYGVAYDLVDISVDVRSGDVVAKSGRVAGTGHAGVPPDGGLATLVEGYRTELAPIADRVIGDAEGELTRSGGELGRLVAAGERAFARTDAAVVSPGALRADIDAGPITYAELAKALAYDHPLMRFEMSGRELRSLASGDAHYAGPANLDPDATYSVAASELFVARGRPVGTEVEALAWYLTRGGG